MSIQQEKFKAIADKIRNHLGGEELIAPNDFADKIDVIVEQKYSTGKQAGIEQGKQAQYDEFWDAYLRGFTSNYNNAKQAFGSHGWNDITFKPPIGARITIANAERFFRECRITNLKGILEERDVVFDFSKCQYFSDFAYYSTITAFPVFNVSSATSIAGIFCGCSKLVTIEKLILNGNGTTTASDSTFSGCAALENIRFEGVIGNNINFKACPLTKASITNIVEHLSDTSTGKTLTLKNTAVENAFETSEGAADGSTSDEWTTLLGAKTNWTISLV